ncbi:hypothetical protein ES703_06352 [subsurface metagenome]
MREDEEMAKEKDPEWLRQLKAADKAAQIVFNVRLTDVGSFLLSKAAEKLPFLVPSPAEKPKADPNDPYSVLDIPSNSPDWLVPLAYRAKASKMHPDHGGSDEEMKKVNKAFEKIKEERGMS